MKEKFGGFNNNLFSGLGWVIIVLVFFDFMDYFNF